MIFQFIVFSFLEETSSGLHLSSYRLFKMIFICIFYSIFYQIGQVNKNTNASNQIHQQIAKTNAIYYFKPANSFNFPRHTAMKSILLELILKCGSWDNYLRIIDMQNKVNFLLDRSCQFGPQHAQVLDQLTIAIKSNSADSRDANEAWRVLKEDHYFWYNAPSVLQLCSAEETKVFMLVLLEDAVKQKWLALPEDQRISLKNYIVDLILKYSSAESLSKPLHNILSKCNSILVQIVKYEWNTSWRSFINDICESSTKDMNICENNFYILKMLSEEIFDHSKNQMTQHQIQQLKTQMNADFTTIFQLCKLILQNMHQVKQSLIKACLETLNAFLSWIPMVYIIYSDLIDKLVLMFPSDYLRNHALACLVEIACLTIEDNQNEKRKYLFMLQRVTEELNKLIPLTNDDQRVQQMLQSVKKKNRNIFEVLARGIANFYSEFFKNQYSWLESTVYGNDEAINVCQMGFRYILMMMKVEEDQVFKITIDFFHFYLGAYLQRQSKGDNYFGGVSYGAKASTLNTIYQPIFLEVMKTVVLKMAKPEQVLIEIDEDGIPVRVQMENTENTSLYEIQKELAQYLIKYNTNQMKQFIIQEIEKQNTLAFNFDTLSSLSWTVGSLCGTMPEKEERSFFITTLRNLLQLCESKKGKENKAVIASCIMYVVGQYPTFLKVNWNFLKTVIRKLFEFMREDYPGIMEMACNSFLKICKNTSQQFTRLQQGQQEPHIHEILRKVKDTTSKFNSDTLYFIFYESIGYLIASQQEPEVQLNLMKHVLEDKLNEYFNIVNMGRTNVNFLKEEDVARKLAYFFKLNENLAIGVGKTYALLLGILSQSMNSLYLFYEKEVNMAVNLNGKNVLNFMTVRNMRMVKKQVIKVYTRMLEKSTDLSYDEANTILVNFIYPLGELLTGFQECIPETKEQEFVALFTVVLERLSMVLNSQFLSKLIEMIFTSSLPLITSDFNSFPQIRANFFAFLKSLVKYNFAPLFDLRQDYLNAILDCIIWSFRHELSTYSDLGLELLEDVLTNVNKNSQVSNAFYARYHMKIVTDILDVMTDGFHRSGIDAQTKIFFILVHVTTQNFVIDSIAADKPPQQSNSEYLYNFLVSRLTQAFPNVNKSLTAEKVANWFKLTDEKAFKLQIADYLVLINRFCPQDLSNQK